ncbi:MAG TPA: TRAP transporter substrate-binding protein DctP, partial [Usitatibacter sp.]
MKTQGRWWRSVAAVAAVAAMSLGSAAAADATVRWKMQSWFPTKLPHVGSQALDIARKAKEVSGGTIQIHVFEPGALIPPAECFDAVSNGAVDLCWGVAGYYYGKNPALAVFSAIPFGPKWPEMLAYFYYGGAREQYEAIYARNNIKGLVCGGTVAEASGWFRKEIKTVDDLKGLKFRIAGMGGHVLAKLGIVPQQIAGGDVYSALEKGSIDAAEFVGPYDDEKLGFYKVAKYYYFPGWWEGGAMLHMIVNDEKWNALPKQYQAILNQAGAAAGSWMIEKYDSVNPAAL